MSTWNKMDREVWKSSEVMQELERKLAHTMDEMQGFAKQAGIKEVTEDVKNLGTHAPPAAEGVQQVADAVEKLEGSAEDEIPEEAEEDVKEAAVDLIEELTKLSYKLADDGDTALAYKVERVIQDIESGFLPNED
jgi:hypothetical protein